MPTYRLMDKIQIVQNTRSPNDFEPNPESWEEVHSAWADIRPVGSMEQVNAKQTIGVVTHRCIIRQPYKPLKTSMRIQSQRHGTLGIVGITDVDGRGDYLELMCRQGETSGSV